LEEINRDLPEADALFRKRQKMAVFGANRCIGCAVGNNAAVNKSHCAIRCGKGLEAMTNRSLVVFVHGIESNSQKCWGDLLDLMKKDPAITSAFDLLAFDYSSRVESTLFHPSRKLPEYGVIAKEFEGFLELNFTPAYDELYLCGHSQGGLII
jgi:pimeloyl-ACP methyl ester carboxylesterase